MRISPGLMTFLIGLLLLAGAGMIYQHQLVASGAYGSPAAGASGAVTAQAAVKYTCPMHPEVVQDGPGSCPICGMDLVPLEPASTPVQQAPEETIYTCPMHPQIEQDHPGTCPICGMELVPKHNDTSEVDPTTGEAVAAVKLSPLQAVLSDVTPVHPVEDTMNVTVSGIGEVKVPQDQENMLVSWQGGRVDNLIVRETGGEIKKGEHLLDIYSEELVQAQDEYLLALKAKEELGNSDYETVASSTLNLFDASRRKLLRLGMSADELAQLEQTRTVQDHIPIYATHGGIIMSKAITEGMYVKEGSMLFTVADLDPIWVEVEVFEQDMQKLQAGKHVTLDCPIHPGMKFKGTIDLIEPSLDPATRTHKARVVVDNPDFILRPGMIVNASMTVDYGKMLLLPRNAVLHTGDGDLVYILAGENLWEPRQVKIGKDFGDRLQILSGIGPEDAVAGTAVFLLDSEAQLKGVPRPIDKQESKQMEGGDAGSAE